MTGGKAPKQKGDRWERDVVAFLRRFGFDAVRRYGAGRPDDLGDLIIGAWIPLLVECKAVAAAERPRWIDAAWRKIRRSYPTALPVIIEKRHGRSDPADGYVTMDLRGFCELIQRIAHRIGELEERELDVDDPRTGAR